MARGGGGAGAGCGALSLLGLLIGVGLTVWLGSKVFETDASNAVRDRANSATAQSGEKAEVELDQSEGLGEGDTVRVTSSGFAPGSQVSIATCVGRGSVVAGEPVCDAASAARVEVGADGLLAVDFEISRLVEGLGVPFDCASGPNTCLVLVSGQSQDGPRNGGTGFSFAPQPRPPLDPDLGG